MGAEEVRGGARVRANTTVRRCRLFASNESKYAFLDPIECGEREQSRRLVLLRLGPILPREATTRRSVVRLAPIGAGDADPMHPVTVRGFCRAPRLPRAKVPATLLPEIHLPSNTC